MNNASLALQHLLADGGTGYLCCPSHEGADWVLLAVDTIKAVAAGTS